MLFIEHMIVIDIWLYPVFLLNSHVVKLLYFHLLSCLSRILYFLAIASVWDDLAELFELTLSPFYNMYMSEIIRDRGVTGVGGAE